MENKNIGKEEREGPVQTTEAKLGRLSMLVQTDKVEQIRAAGALVSVMVKLRLVNSLEDEERRGILSVAILGEFTIKGRVRIDATMMSALHIFGKEYFFIYIL